MDADDLRCHFLGNGFTEEEIPTVVAHYTALSLFRNYERAIRAWKILGEEQFDNGYSRTELGIHQILIEHFQSNYYLILFVSDSISISILFYSILFYSILFYSTVFLSFF